MSEYFELVGFEFDLAVSAEQARNNLKRSRYDVVVSDFNMPGESGLDLFRYVSSVYPEIPFVLVTGCDVLQVKRESTRMGVHAFISKPFQLDELRQTILNQIERKNRTEVPCLDRPECLKPTLKIAFCGDNEDELRFLQRALEDAGYRDTICACAFSGKDLLHALCPSEGALPDAILLDILVLFGDGLNTLDEIRRDPKFQNIPVLLMTGAPEFAKSVADRYPHLAIDGSLVKPITIDSLANVLKPYHHCF